MEYISFNRKSPFKSASSSLQDCMLLTEDAEVTDPSWGAGSAFIYQIESDLLKDYVSIVYNNSQNSVAVLYVISTNNDYSSGPPPVKGDLNNDIFSIIDINPLEVVQGGETNAAKRYLTFVIVYPDIRPSTSFSISLSSVSLKVNNMLAVTNIPRLGVIAGYNYVAYGPLESSKLMACNYTFGNSLQSICAIVSDDPALDVTAYINGGGVISNYQVITANKQYVYLVLANSRLTGQLGQIVLFSEVAEIPLIGG